MNGFRRRTSTNTRSLIFLAVTLLLCSCGNDRTGRMRFTGIIDANTVRISAETPGRVLELCADEGSVVRKDSVLARIETERLGYQLDQSAAQRTELTYHITSARARMEAARIQRDNLARRYRRLQTLLEENAATQQAVDDLQAQLAAADAELDAADAELAALFSKRTQLDAGENIVRKQLREAEISAPLTGTVLVRYTEVGELLGTGSPVFEIADLTNLWTRIHVAETQLPHIRLGQPVLVSIDGAKDTLQGTITWISETAAFTPKTILTEETRTSLVYPVKVRITNENHLLKIGMPVTVLVERNAS